MADAIVTKRREKVNVSIDIVVDPSADPLRLGFGEIGGLKMLQNDGIGIRCQPGLRIGVVIVDDHSWIFAPTPEIILEKPEPGTVNAINVSTTFTKWLMHAIAPVQGYLEQAEDILDQYRPADLKIDGESDSDDGLLDDEIIDSKAEREDPLETNDPTSVRDIEPEIGRELMLSEQLIEIETEVVANPPKQFDHEREILVYSGYFHFVEMKFSGGRLSSRTIRLPDHLLNLVDDPATTIEIRTTCKLFDDIDSLCPEIREFERTVNDARRNFTHPLGNELGSVILATDREKFNKRLVELNEELGVLTKAMKTVVSKALNERLSRLIEIFVPLLLGHPNAWMKQRFEGMEKPEDHARKLVERALTRVFPHVDSIMEKMEIRCTFKDVTWEMLNDRKFGEAINNCFPDSKFTKLYKERQAIGERLPKQRREITTDDWPEELDAEPDRQ
jgi:hypothetical protein